MLLLYVITVLLMVSGSLGCSCAKTSLHQYVCDSEFIIRGSVRSVPGSQSNDDVYYNVKILDILKQPSYALSKGKEVKIWTPGNDGICRAPLSHGEDYYIGGSIDKGTSKLRIHLCNFRSRTSALKDCRKRMIAGNVFDCSCKTPECFQDC
ncbi:metalloproteinase inhibitor 2-like [Mytilus californianus]|uniref:metalloproteinase inhibitor 2-like n=1 Tax=Mytilus californianus TaxID=6549 RepID=UPI002247484D|nr:metalloproteinase inhibitor 2-like [Mytilus californianus]XP_052059720.1 metalloproteinase inhibitor 2-like [Mytilus californianus]